MQLNNQISTWLDSPEDYHYGISLLAKTSKKKHLLSMLQRKESDKNRSKLVYELQKHLKSQNYGRVQTHKETQKETSQNTTIPKRQQPDRRGTHSSQPVQGTIQALNNSAGHKHLIGDNQHSVDVGGVAQELTQKRNALYAKRAHYHGQLHIAPTKPKRFKLAKSIMEIQPIIDKYNMQLKFINENGKLPQELSGLVVDAKTQRRITTLNSYLSRYRKKIEESKTVAERDKYQELLDNYTAEYESLKY